MPRVFLFTVKTRPNMNEVAEDNKAISLAEAAEKFGYPLSTLRLEERRGNLTVYKLGRKFYTTPNDIQEMVRRCRVVRKVPDFISIPSGANGQSETDRASSALAAANETVRMLKNTSRNTLVTSISRNRQVRR